MSARARSVLILGSGPAGCTAAIYAARANLEPLMIEGPRPGGQLTITTTVENFPGFPEGISGPDLMERMKEQARICGTTITRDVITRVDLSKRPFHLWGEEEKEYAAETLIIATGAEAKWLNILGESAFHGYGVSGCATCDGMLFRDKDVAVVGGGNTAAEEALFLARFARSVTLIHRRDRLRAEPVMQARLQKHPKIRFLWDTVVEEVLGEENPRHVTSIRVKNVKTAEMSVLPIAGLFVAIGHAPDTAIFKDWLPIDDTGYIVADAPLTKIPGVFVAGDVCDSTYRQAITAAGLGCGAALAAQRFLEEA